MKTIILINGKARSGKDTLAQKLYTSFKNTGLKVVIRPNAKGVKTVAKTIFNWNGDKDTRGRRLLIDITNAGYNYDPNFWEAQNNLMFGTEDVIIIPDWRYKSTYDYFNTKEGYKVITVNITNDMREYIGELSNHSSETGLDDFKFDYCIFNNDTLDSLEIRSKELSNHLIADTREV